ncbi:MAG: ribosomal protein S18-alanine N-acetyltransferase [Motiliproteus sp.]|nr:ribosomal protein S18-alanine N-acetyltransferase [Motiliproteus sp.]MCW9053373.1 ribosomal protein S18-alanine N-acetyltransferase [Motiliproteus sp.]
MNLTIRPIVDTDLPSVAELESQLFSHPHSIDQLQKMVAAHESCWVAEIDRRLAGYIFASFGGGQADLLIVAVDSKYQKQGVATRLMEQLIDQLHSLLVDSLFLEVRASNQAAIGFYRQQGFSEIGVRRNYYPLSSAIREDALLFKKDC